MGNKKKMKLWKRINDDCYRDMERLLDVKDGDACVLMSACDGIVGNVILGETKAVLKLLAMSFLKMAESMPGGESERDEAVSRLCDMIRDMYVASKAPVKEEETEDK